MFKRIIVPLDGSPLAEASLPYAVLLAARLEANLLLLRIAPSQFEAEHHFVGELQAINDASSYLTYVRNLLTEPGRAWQLSSEKVEVIVRLSPHPGRLVSQIPLKEGDLIVMATHARIGLDRLFHENLALKLLHEGRYPVIMVRPDNFQQLPPLIEVLEASPLFGPDQKQWPDKLVVALDGSLEAEVALQPAIELAVQLKTELTLLRITEPWVGAGAVEMQADYGLLYSESEIAQANKHLREEAYCYLRTQQGELLNQELNCSMLVHTGQPAEEIIHYLNSDRAADSLVVMAQSVRSKAKHLLFSSIADKVLHEIRQPVLMVSTGTAASLESVNKETNTSSTTLPV